MNENSPLSLSGSRVGLVGLPKRLVTDGFLDVETALELVRVAHEKKLPFVTHAVSQGALKAKDVALAASEEFGIPLVDADMINLDPDVLNLVNDKLLAKYRVLPLFLRGKRLYVGISDPTYLHSLDEIKFQTGMTLDVVLLEDDKLQAAIDKHIKQVEHDEGLFDDHADVDLEGLDVSSVADESTEAIVTRDDVEDAPIVKFVNKVLLDAIRRGASDIHFEPYEKNYRIRFRVDGVLKEIVKPPVHIGTKLAARLKVMARLDIAERRVPQDGRIKMRLSKTRAIDFRVSTCPTLFGEKVVMRILDASQAMLGIDSLGYEPFQKDLYMEYLAKPQGMILVTGPTGSGKTVSLYTGLNILNTEDTNISTAEDPSEINLPGVNQVNINPKVGLTFAAAMRAFLRQDPDVIMVGEIRDKETAEIAIKAAQTGHLVLSTLHTNDAPQTLTRMIDMGVKPYAIATSVSLIIAQRLARRLCQSCKQPVELPREALLKEGFSEAEVDAGITVYRPSGCSSCTDGYKGRIGIYQVMPVTDAIARIILANGSAMEIADQAAKEGVWDLHRAGLEKVKAGVTSLEEVNSVTVE